MEKITEFLKTIIFFIIAGGCVLIYFKARKGAKILSNKAQKINEFTKEAYKNFADGAVDIAGSREAIVDSVVLGIGATGLNLLDIYSSISDHTDVLDSIADGLPEQLANHDGMDLFAKISDLKSEGTLDVYASEMGQDVVNDIYDSGDIMDNIPWIAVAIFGVRTVRNAMQYKKEKQSTHEFKINVATDFVRIAVGGLFATGGAKIGTALGTMIAPGVGTLVGAGAGVFVGAFAGGSIFNKIKEKAKWGKITNSLDYFNEKYGYKYSENMKQNIKNRFFHYDDIDNKLSDEIKLLEEYKDELDINNPKEPTIAAVMAREYCEILKRAKDKIENSLQKTEIETRRFAENLIKSSDENIDDSKIDILAKRVATVVLLENKWIFENENLDDEDLVVLDTYNKQVELAPNHPYALNADSEEILKAVVYNSYDNLGTNY